MTTGSPNLTAALRASLVMEEQATTEPSPLSEVDSNAIDLWLDAANADLIAGMPEKITGNPERLGNLVDIFRAQALKWEQEEQTKKTKERTSRTKKTHAEAVAL